MQSYRVYLQHVSSLHSPQFHSSDQTNFINTSSILIKLSETSTCEDLVLLLRDKLTISCPEFFPTRNNGHMMEPLMSNLHVSSSNSSMYTSDIISNDSLVLVLTCAKSLVYYEYRETTVELNPNNSKEKYIDPTTSTITTGSKIDACSEEDTETVVIQEPLHFVRSLAMNEFPAQIQRNMLKQFINKIHSNYKKATIQGGGGDTTMAIDIRWFFIPSCKPQVLQQQQYGNISPLFPTFIELNDGYCTGENSDEDSDDDGDDDSLDNHEIRLDPILPVPIPQRLLKERRKMAKLDHDLLLHQNECITGYLLKQCTLDPFVWRRVYCILVDDGFWWIFRTKSYSYQKRDSSSSFSSYSLGKRGYVALTGATILQVNHPTIPHVFEISSSQGQTYTFRSSKRSIQVQWIDWISSRVASCHCDHWMVMADIMIGDESAARFSKLDTTTNRNTVG